MIWIGDDVEHDLRRNAQLVVRFEDVSPTAEERPTGRPSGSIVSHTERSCVRRALRAILTFGRVRELVV